MLVKNKHAWGDKSRPRAVSIGGVVIGVGRTEEVDDAELEKMLGSPAGVWYMENALEPVEPKKKTKAKDKE